MLILPLRHAQRARLCYATLIACHLLMLPLFRRCRHLAIDAASLSLLLPLCHVTPLSQR